MNSLLPEQRQSLQRVRDALLELHTVLMHSERAWYEHEVQPIASNLEMLNLLMNDPAFAWLRELSGLVAAMDELLSPRTEATGEQAGAAIFKARELLRPEETGGGFRQRYWEVMQRDPEVILVHGRLRKLIVD